MHHPMLPSHLVGVECDDVFCAVHDPVGPGTDLSLFVKGRSRPQVGIVDKHSDYAEADRLLEGIAGELVQRGAMSVDVMTEVQNLGCYVTLESHFLREWLA